MSKVRSLLLQVIQSKATDSMILEKNDSGFEAKTDGLSNSITFNIKFLDQKFVSIE